MLANTIHPRAWIGLILLIAARAASAQDWLNTEIFDIGPRDEHALYEVRSDAASHDWSQIEKAAYVEPQPEPDPSEEIIVDTTEEVVVAPPCCMPGSPLLSSVYFRVDSFAWIERVNDRNVVEETGPMFTIGWEHAFRRIRLRGELFGGQVDHNEYFSDAYIEGKGDYLGFRGEIDLLFQPESWPRSNLIAGLGTRFWRKHLHDGVLHYAWGSDEIDDISEKWFTIYPYVGIETKKRDLPEWKFYGSARLGFPAFTVVDHSYTGVNLHPTPGILAQLEAGFSSENNSIGLYYDVTGWGSDRDNGRFQPAAGMGFLGIKAALLY